MKQTLFVICLLSLLYFLFPLGVAQAQYNDCTCNGNSCSDPAPGLGKDCSAGSVGGCGTQSCSPDFVPTQKFCGGVACGSPVCVYNASCVGGGDCSCSGNGNCYDPDPILGKNCSVGIVNNCGTSGCGADYKSIQQKCGTASCGYKCIYDQLCSAGFCANGPGVSCINTDGTFLCGDGGCGSCSRFIRETNCNGSQCQVQCSPDPNCGAGCPGGSGPTATPGGGGGGPTNTPGGPTDTPIPTSTPVPVGTIRARAVAVDPSDTSCSVIRAVSTSDSDINGAQHQFTSNSASEPSPLTQSGAGYVTFSNVETGSYTLDPSLPGANWVLARACWSVAAGSVGEGFNALLGVNETLTYDIGYTLGTAWVQTGGGDVYAAGSIKSYIPDVTPRVFSKDGAGGSPGVVTYGTGYDFDGTSADTGSIYKKSRNYNMRDSFLLLGL